jgi:aryl-alcohol dehydrogenase-like predicted oxidoreductase
MKPDFVTKSSQNPEPSMNSLEPVQLCRKSLESNDTFVRFSTARKRSTTFAQRGGPLDEIAKRHGATIAKLSIAWLLHHSPVMLPIPGTSSVQHLEENVASANLRLSDSEREEVERSAGV